MYQLISIQAKCDYKSSIATHRSLDTQFETKIEKAHFSLQKDTKTECGIKKRDLLTHCPNEAPLGDIDLGQVNACSLTAPIHNLNKCPLEFLAYLCSAICNEILQKLHYTTLLV